MRYMISEEFKTEQKSQYYMIAIMLPVCIIWLLMVLLRFRIEPEAHDFIIKLAVGIIVFLEIEIFVVGKIMMKKICGMTLSMDETGLKRVNGNITEHMNYSDIVEATVIKNPKNTKLIQIVCKSKGKTLMLAGFENMDEIKENFMNANVAFKEKKVKIDWSNKLIFMCVFISMMLVLSAFMVANFDFYMYMIHFIQIGLGIFILKGKMISKSSGMRFRKFEVILGVGMTIIGVFNIAISAIDRML